ncbi:hypothetical protein K461DRAFT_278492 [Myriangium duriaei CBS 260.36]|uniref:Uncharacterized protein n=1 Tax=Myriangium duriaei CBS 260.36 TaxID=1168546 RepID=A0A9P4J2K5_9PEZI|nr:hypothetical protein K461DRAFT_278492 [Myriangium duriaei CBS 260.36]
MPTCLASTTTSSDNAFPFVTSTGEPNCFRLAALAADGTSIITYNEDQRLRTFILPPTLLAPSTTTPLPLPVYTTSRPCKSYSFALYPHFSLPHPSTTLLLHSRFDTPIRLTNALDLSYSHASYPLVNPTTEAYICPHSLAFTPDGSRFIAGAKESISVFDVSRDGQSPVRTLPTRPGRKARKLYGTASVGMAGYVTALSICAATDVLAAGSTGAQIALYSQGGAGEEVASFQLGEEEGNGVSQVTWDESGTWLFVAGRQADCVAVYDVRMGRRVGLLVGRKAGTTARMGFEVVEAEGGCDVWAGGVDGCVRVWKGAERREGRVEADVIMEGSGDAVTWVKMHPGRDVYFTASGLRREVGVDDEDRDDGVTDASLKAWAV